MEVLIAAALLSTALATLAMLLPGALDATRLSGDRFAATMLARQKLEELATSAPGTASAASGEDVVQGGASGVFKRHWRVEQHGIGPQRWMTIRVDVERRSAGVADRTTLVTLSIPVR